MLIIPLMGLTSPFRDSSPTNTLPRTSAMINWPDRTSIDKAIGRSKYAPSLGSSAGAKLMVTFLSGNEKSEFTTALRTRSRDSLMVLLAIPTILKAGSPLFISPSTSTSLPSKP